MEENEKIVGAFLHASAPSQHYMVFHLVFTSNRVVLIPQKDWVKNVFADGVPPKTSEQEIWVKFKNGNVNKPSVSYEYALPDKVLHDNELNEFLNGILVIPYNRIKKIAISLNAGATDYKVEFQAGLRASVTLLIPLGAINEFKGLVAKTPASAKLSG